MVPGHKVQVILMAVKLNQFVDYSEILKTNLNEFLNKITSILHNCAYLWDGWANKTDGDKFLISWKLPEAEQSSDAEKNEQVMEQRTELADKSLITAVKIISEIRRAAQFNIYFKNSRIAQKFPGKTRPHLTIGLHMGWIIEGAIGSDQKIDASYLSPNIHITNRIQDLTQEYEMQILLTDSLYNLMSLKARNTLRKVDVITFNTYKN